MNIPFIEAIIQTPRYASLLKDLLTNRRNMAEVTEIVLSEHCSAAMMNELPEKMGDLGNITLP